MRIHRQCRRLVLVVQADPLLLGQVAGMLEDGGYEVFEAESAIEAFRFLETHGDEVLALFSDLQLPPQIAGPTLEQTINARWPHIRQFMRGTDIFDTSFDHAEHRTH